MYIEFKCVLYYFPKMIVIRNQLPCCLHVLSNIVLINYHSVVMPLQSHVIINYNSVVMPLQSHVIINYNSVVMSLQSQVTYFLHVHTGTGAGAGAEVGVGDNRGTETMNGVPHWWHLIPPVMDKVVTSWCCFWLQEGTRVLVMKFTICVFAFFQNC